MISLILIILTCSLVAKIAEMDGQSRIIWGCAAFVIGFGSAAFVPLLFLEPIVTLALSLSLMYGYKTLFAK